MEESGSEGLDDTLVKRKEWLKVIFDFDAVFFQIISAYFFL